MKKLINLGATNLEWRYITQNADRRRALEPSRNSTAISRRWKDARAEIASGLNASLAQQPAAFSAVSCGSRWPHAESASSILQLHASRANKLDAGDFQSLPDRLMIEAHELGLFVLETTD